MTTFLSAIGQHPLIQRARKNADALNVAFLVGGIAVLAILFQGWNQPVISDRTFHIYSAQEIARGRTPYVDFFNIHPPMGILLMAIPMWLVPILRTGAGPAQVHSALTIIWSMIGVIAAYDISRQLTKSRYAAMVAGLVWIGLTPLFLRHFSIGQNRFLVTTSILVTVALLQRGKWYWAGFSLGVGFMTYYPTILGICPFFLLLVFRDWRTRTRMSVAFFGGFATVLALVVLWLVASNGLTAWINVTLRWPFARSTSGAGDGFSLVSFLERQFNSITKIFQKSYNVLSLNLLWVPVGGIVSYFSAILSEVIRKRRISPILGDGVMSPALSMTAMFALYLLIEHGNLDSLMLQAFIAIWFAYGVWVLLMMARRKHPLLGVTAAVTVTLLLGISSFRLVDSLRPVFQSGMHSSWRKFILQSERSINTQVDASKVLFQYLPDTSTILVLGDLWFLNVTDRENPSRFYHTGEKMQLSAVLAGYATSPNDMFGQLLDTNPDIALISEFRGGAGYRKLTDEFQAAGYICAGEAGDVLEIIHPTDAAALAGSFAMQQVFNPVDVSNSPWEGAVVSLDALAELPGLYVRETAPGVLLLSASLNPEKPDELVLYWWAWVAEKDQMDLRLAVETEAGRRLEMTLNEPRFPEDVLIRQAIDLSELGAIDGAVTLEITRAGQPPKNPPCKTDFSTEALTLTLPPED